MIIHGSDINQAALSEIKSLKDLKKLKIFSHLPNENEANEDLWEAIKPVPAITEEVPDTSGND